MPQRGKKDQFYKHFVKHSLGEAPVPAARKAEGLKLKLNWPVELQGQFLLPVVPLVPTTDRQVVNMPSSFQAAFTKLPCMELFGFLFLADQS